MLTVQHTLLNTIGGQSLLIKMKWTVFTLIPLFQI